MLVIGTQALYLLLSVAMTIYVGHSLHSRGRIFLVRTFSGDEGLADSVNHLLIVGFYLVNLGAVLLWTRYGTMPANAQAAIEFATTKVGVVMFALGVAHLFNVRLFWILGKRGIGEEYVARNAS